MALLADIFWCICAAPALARAAVKLWRRDAALREFTRRRESERLDRLRQPENWRCR